VDTVGALCDKLTIVNMKLWHKQDVVHEIRRMSLDDFRDRFTHEDLYHLFQALADLNLQRNQLIDEIDETIAEAIRTGDTSKLVQRKHKVTG